MCCTESIIHEYISERSELLAEISNLGLVGLDLVSLGVGTFALFFRVEAQVLEQGDFSVGGRLD